MTGILQPNSNFATEPCVMGWVLLSGLWLASLILAMWAVLMVMTLVINDALKPRQRAIGFILLLLNGLSLFAVMQVIVVGVA